ncbi:cytochrome P450 2J2-like, partial [Emydura macquarii macquarii]|uniref:cytochrome P450 2J2-like n=1 Tax=Emydura macquarii macquarii TaxID=1129001 RepID=UPI00352A4DDD
TMFAGQPLDPSFPIVHSVSNVIAAVVFGHRFTIENKNFHQVIENNDYIVKFGSSVSEMLYDIFPWLMNHLPGPHQKVFYCHEFLRSFARNEIRNHRENGPPDELQDFIDFYLAQIDKSKDDPTSTFDEDNMVQAIFDLFLAGTETTTTTLRWTVLDMVAHPDVQEKVQKELDAVLGPSQLICYEDRKKLPYTNAVIHEIQRYNSVVAVGVPRECIRGTVLQGFPIEKGTIIIPNLTSALLDPEQWETPRQFNPNHFLDKDGNFVNKDAFLPFSAGHRMCLGELLARTELFLFFSNLMRAFTFKLPEGVKEINTEAITWITLQPHPYKICAVPR